MTLDVEGGDADVGRGERAPACVVRDGAGEDHLVETTARPASAGRSGPSPINTA